MKLEGRTRTEDSDVTEDRQQREVREKGKREETGRTWLHRGKTGGEGDKVRNEQEKKIDERREEIKKGRKGGEVKGRTQMKRGDR